MTEQNNEEREHELSSDCWCNPVLKGEFWIHRSDDGSELDEEGYEITLPARVAEPMILFCYWMHWISGSRARESLGLTHSGLEIRFQKFLEEIVENQFAAEEYKAAELLLRPPAD